MILWSVLVFSLVLCGGGGISVNGEGYQAIPLLLRPYFEDNQVSSGGGLYPGLNEDSGDFATIRRKDQHETRGGYDFIIVGGGTTGSVLASRLTENPRLKVLLLEAGQIGDIITEIPAAQFYLKGSNYTQTFMADATVGACLGSVEGRCAMTTGVGLGGSSLTNNMLVVRGNSEDYDEWEKMGNEGWSYNDLLPFFKKSERVNLNFPSDGDFRSDTGQWNVETPHYVSPLADRYLVATQELDHDEIDFNGEQQIGSGIVQGSTQAGRRHSTAAAYLYPVHKKRRNLVILTGALVKRVLIDDTTKSAFGVEYLYNGRLRRAVAIQEVILSAGTFRSPQLLMLSGVGPREHLKSHGIHCKMDLPVGENLHDHLAFPGITFLLSGTHEERSAANDESVLTSLGFEAVSFLKLANTSRASYSPEVQVLMFNRNLNGLNLGEGLWNSLNLQPDIYRRYLKSTDRGYINSMTLFVVPLNPKVRGSVTIRNKKIESAPTVNLPYLSNEEDMQVMMEGIEQTLVLLETKAMKTIGARLHTIPVPGCEAFPFGTEDYWRCAVRVLSVSFSDHGGTVKMGPSTDPKAVVDDKLRVHGLKKLRVADRSILPTPISGQTQAIAVVVGEKLADLLMDTYETAERYKEVDVLPGSPQTSGSAETLSRIILPKDLETEKDKFFKGFHQRKFIKHKKKGHHGEDTPPIKQDDLPYDTREKEIEVPKKKESPPKAEKRTTTEKPEKPTEEEKTPEKTPEPERKKEPPSEAPKVLIVPKEKDAESPPPAVHVFFKQDEMPEDRSAEKVERPVKVEPPPAAPKPIEESTTTTTEEPSPKEREPAPEPEMKKVAPQPEVVVVVEKEEEAKPPPPLIIPDKEFHPVEEEVVIPEIDLPSDEEGLRVIPVREYGDTDPPFFGSSYPGKSSSSSEEDQPGGHHYFIRNHVRTHTWGVPSISGTPHRKEHHHYHTHRHHYHHELPAHYHGSHEVYVDYPHRKTPRMHYESHTPVYRYVRSLSDFPVTVNDEAEKVDEKPVEGDAFQSEQLVHIIPSAAAVNPQVAIAPPQSLMVELNIRQQGRTSQLQTFRGILRPVLNVRRMETPLTGPYIAPTLPSLDDPSLRYNFTMPTGADDPLRNAADSEVFQLSSEESDEESDESEENYHGKPIFIKNRKNQESEGFVRIMTLQEFYNEVNQITPPPIGGHAQEVATEAIDVEDKVKVKRGEEEAMAKEEGEEEVENSPKHEDDEQNKEPTTTTTARPSLNRRPTLPTPPSRPSRTRRPIEKDPETTTARPIRRSTSTTRPIYTRRPLTTRPTRKTQPEATDVPRVLRTTTHITQRFTNAPTRPSTTTEAPVTTTRRTKGTRTTRRFSVMDREFTTPPTDQDFIYSFRQRNFQDRYPLFKSGALMIDPGPETEYTTTTTTTERVAPVHEAAEERFPNSRSFSRMFPGFSFPVNSNQLPPPSNQPNYPAQRKKPQSYNNYQQTGQTVSWSNITLSF